MAIENYYNLPNIHPVIEHFIEDHYVFIQCYEEGYQYLCETMPVEETVAFAKAIDFYRQISIHHSNLILNFSNFLISYYQFKQIAQTNESVMTEFNKLPNTIFDILNKVDSLILGYEKVRETMKTLI